MVARVIRDVVLIVLTGLILTGCGRQVAKDSSRDPDLSATGPASGPVAAAIEAVGGLPAWRQCRSLDFDAIVTAHHSDGSLYLTEHRFTLSPWADSIQVTAGEPRAQFTWRVVCGQCFTDGDPTLDVSPLSGLYREYGEAVLQIATVPARMLASNVTLTRKPMPVQIAGLWHQPIEVKFRPQKTLLEDEGRKRVAVVEPYWSQGIYFQDHSSAIVDMIWLANPFTQKFLLIRGYDYAKIAGGEVLIPTKVEIFQSDSEAQFGPRLALIDLKR
jgi:hypothetical protein